MPFDSNGVFSRVMNWTSDQQNGIAIECGRHDAEDNNFAEGFNETFCRDGRAAATGNFNLGNHKIQNLADGIAATDAVTKGQLDASSAAGVSLNTAQTITGQKTFTDDIVAKINYSRGTAPASSAYPKPYLIYDTNNKMFGCIQLAYFQNQTVRMELLAYNGANASDDTPASMGVVNNNGNKYTFAPTPTEDTTNSTQIDTVGARNTKLGNYVTLGTEQTITGAKTFANNVNLSASANGYRHIYSNNTSITKGTAPSTNTGTDIVLRDSAGSNISTFTTWYNTSGNINIGLNAFTPTAGSTGFAQLKVSNYASGRADIQFSTPSGVTNTCLETATASTSSEVIPTMGWVNNPATSTNVVHRTDNETIGGTKTFTKNPVNIVPAQRGIGHNGNKYGGFSFHDSDDYGFAALVAASGAGTGTGNVNPGNSSIWLSVQDPNYKPSNPASGTSDSTIYMTLHYDADGAKYATCPPSDVNGSIVTTVNKSKTTNGYYQLGNGLIVQWGSFSTSGTITLPKAFTSTNYKVACSETGDHEYGPRIGNLTKTTFDVLNSRPGMWIAIGY